MSVTYLDTLATDRDRVRFAIGDIEEDAGPKPADANFTDAELAGLIRLEGTWQRATAAAFESLAALWARHVTFTAGASMSANQSDIATAYRTLAEQWRRDYGRAASSACGSVATIRADGYSNDLDNVTTEDYL